MVVLTLAVSGLVVSAGAAVADYSSVARTTTWSPMNGRVYAIEKVGSTVFIGGSFTTLRAPAGGQTVTRNRLAAFDATTGALLPWAPNVNGDVRALQGSSDGGGLFLGGSFSSVNGTARNRMAEVSTATGAVVTGFSANVNGTVYALERVGTRVFLGGGFSTLAGAARPRVAAVDEATGTAVTGWNGSADAQVKSLMASPDGSRIYVGGEFRTLGSATRNFVGALNVSDGSVNGWTASSPCSDLQNPCFVLDIAVDANRVYGAVGGPGGRVVAWDNATGQRRWAAYGDGDAQAVAVADGVVYVGGHFGPLFAQQERYGFAALSATTGGALAYAPRFDSGLRVWDISAESDVLRVGGGFNRVNGSSQRQRYAEFTSFTGTVDITPPSVPTRLRASNVSDQVANLYWDPSSDDRAVTGYRLLRDGDVVATTNVASYTDRSLSPSTSYRYQVQATDAAGNWSDLSTPLDITTQPPSTSLVQAGSSWRYWSTGSDQGTAWRNPGFNDGGWSQGLAQLGYGDSDESTAISPLGVTHYFRKTFGVTNPSAISGLTLRLLADDGAVVYVNGTEVSRVNMPSGPVTYQTVASSEVSGAGEETWQSRSVPASVLQSGTNTIAVEVHNSVAGDQDCSFDLELVPMS